MKANGNRTKTVAGRRYTDYIKLDLAVLADARRWLNTNAGMDEQSQFTPEESDRRVRYCAEQVEAEGQITRWLVAAPPKPRSRYRTRFAFGNALGLRLRRQEPGLEPYRSQPLGAFGRDRRAADNNTTPEPVTDTSSNSSRGPSTWISR